MNLVFFLGGHDLEMLSIRDFLIAQNQEFFDKQLDWGAKASAYTTEIAMTAANGKIPVLIELAIDVTIPINTIVIDHHGSRSNEDASILQVVKLFELTPTTEQLLIAANDSGYIPAMLCAGATSADVVRIRRLDRIAQGVTEEMEQQAEVAISLAENRNGVTIVRLPHTKSPTVADRLFASWPDGKENLLIVGKINDEDVEVNYFGRGDVCRTMKETFSGWGGGQGFGNPDKNGFAGCVTKNPGAIIEFVIQRQ